MNKKILKLLYRSFDADLDEKEQNQLNEALKNSEELRKLKEHIAAQRQAVSTSASQSFKPFFAERVINRINSLSKQGNGLEAFYETLKLAFKRFALAAAIIMLALFSYNLIKGDILPSNEVYYASNATLEEILELPLF